MTDWEKLAEPVPRDDVKWFPGATKGDKALALAYIDARFVMDRLDAVLGPADWQDSYRVIDPAKAIVECTIAVNVDGHWVSKADVGYPNSNSDDEPMKSAYSDALKRAAVRWGIGRELYATPQVWVPYDAQRRRLSVNPWSVIDSGNVETPPAQRAEPAAPRTRDSNGTRREKTPADLLQWALREHGMKKDDVFKVLEVDSMDGIKAMGLSEATNRIGTHLTKEAAVAQ